MALVVEDGTGLPNSDSYVSLAEVEAYNLLYGADSTWDSLTDEQKEQALRFCTRWLDAKVSYKSSLLSTEQALGFPRIPYYDSNNRYVDGIPNLFKEAFIELVKIHLTDDLKGFDERGTLILSEKVGNSSANYRHSNVLTLKLSDTFKLFREFIERTSNVSVIERC